MEGDASLELAELRIKGNAGRIGIIDTKLCQIVLIFIPLSSVISAHSNSIKRQSMLWVEQSLDTDAGVPTVIVTVFLGGKMSRETLFKKSKDALG